MSGGAIRPVSLGRADADPAGFADALGASFRENGFGIVTDHGIPPDLIAAADAQARTLFALPDTVKRRHHIPGGGGARGYTPFGIETAKDAHAHDLKEFWHIGRDLPPGHRFADRMPPNIQPDLPGFAETMAALYAAFDRVGGALLAAIARDLGLAPDWFDDAVADGNSVLRLLHYPPVPGDAPGVRAGAHEDINAITLLLGAEEAGLELLTRDGRWLAIAPPPGALVVNIGDMLQKLTNHVLPSTTHRVVNPAPERRGIARHSMPFFLHFRPDFMIRTLPGCVTPIRPDRDPQPIAAHDFLMRRLREIGLA